MTPQQLRDYLHSHIPLSKAMEIDVLEIQPRTVVLGAPLEPNINHRNTLFGGSAAAVATLAAWSLLHLRITDEGLESRLVVQRSTMSYKRPVSGSFTAVATLPDDSEWSKFLRILKRREKSRITLGSDLHFDGRTAAHLVGEFVALGSGS